MLMMGGVWYVGAKFLQTAIELRFAVGSLFPIVKLLSQETIGSVCRKLVLTWHSLLKVLLSLN